MNYTVEGIVKKVFDLQTFESGFTKREFVVTTQEDYPQDIKLETIKDKTAILDNIMEGQGVKVSFALRGNEYNGKYYVNLQAWKIEEADIKVPTAPKPVTTTPQSTEDEDDGLPF